MSSLRELQTGFRAALLAGDERGVAPDVVDDGVNASARLAVYRHHVLTSLTAALEATFPVVCRLVDRRFFGWLADSYVRAHPPAGPCLFEYGADLPEFIAAFPACAPLPWLADVARLEWAMNVALHAPDAVPLEPAAPRTLPPPARRRRRRFAACPSPRRSARRSTRGRWWPTPPAPAFGRRRARAQPRSPRARRCGRRARGSRGDAPPGGGGWLRAGTPGRRGRS